MLGLNTCVHVGSLLSAILFFSQVSLLMDNWKSKGTTRSILHSSGSRKQTTRGRILRRDRNLERYFTERIGTFTRKVLTRIIFFLRQASSNAIILETSVRRLSETWCIPEREKSRVKRFHVSSRPPRKVILRSVLAS